MLPAVLIKGIKRGQRENLEKMVGESFLRGFCSVVRGRGAVLPILSLVRRFSVDHQESFGMCPLLL
jgi:hypothetical protein